MGDMNQFNLVKKYSQLVKGSILEIGSKDYGSTPDFRSLFVGGDYVGVDMEEGKGVDVALDLTTDIEELKLRLGKDHFSAIFCLSVLEHCEDPFKMALNISKLMSPGGVLFVSVPFSWRIHGYPSDYWRFTPEGVRKLFPDFNFDEYKGSLSTTIIGETGDLDDYMMRIEFDIKRGLKRRALGYPGAFLIKFFRILRRAPRLFSYPYLSPPIMVNMIGIKK
ncbi:MAG: class I SAM-dependent methyltransferase [Candidatus Omnitrophota bacterium]